MSVGECAVVPGILKVTLGLWKHPLQNAGIRIVEVTLGTGMLEVIRGTGKPEAILCTGILE